MNPLAPGAGRRQQIDALFVAALDLPPAEREGFVAGASGEDASLRQAVLHLISLAGEEEGDTLVLGGALARDLEHQLGGRRPVEVGSRIGPYRIVSEIGRGGMAVVYEAIRVEGGFEQRVALKLLRRGVDSDDIAARFRQERQILASLQHPAIARLLDGGATKDGQPFLAMELVLGEHIDDYCASRGLGVEDRVRLVAEVGKAIAHAHGNLVVHRDLKPSNVLVTSEGRVKLLDFGIAKLVEGGGWAESPPRTRTQQRLLTPEYASPEQIRGEAVTTATDVYQLGLLLYELLAGRCPFAGRSGSPSQLEQAICLENPAPPSAAATREEAADDPPSGDRTTRRRLARQLRGDLDNIVLMALRKEPSRRYASAAALVEDLERFLSGRPVQARPAGAFYRATKFVRRHRWTVGSAAAALVLVVTVTVLYARDLARERDLARRESEKARTVARYLSGVLEVADPFAARGGRLDALALLDESARRVDLELADQPEIRAATLAQLGSLYAQHGLTEQASRRLEQALALRQALFSDDDPQVAESQSALGSFLVRRTGELRRGRSLLEQAYAAQTKRLGAHHPATAETLVELASAESVFSDHELAEEHYREALFYFEANPGRHGGDLARLLVTRAESLSTLPQRAQERIALLERSLALYERAPGEEARVADTLVRLGFARYQIDQPAEALRLLERAEEIAARAFDEDHPTVGALVFYKGCALRDLGRFAAARAALERSIAISALHSGPAGANTLVRTNELIRLLLRMGEPREAQAISARVLAVLEETTGPNSPHLVVNLSLHADVLHRLGDRNDARKALDRAVTLLDEKHAHQLHFETWRLLASLAELLGSPDAAALASAAKLSEAAMQALPEAAQTQPRPSGN